MEEKRVRASRKIISTGSLIALLDTGECKDLNAEYEWTEPLTETQKKFIFYYAYPFYNSAYDQGAESARRAGYSKKIAKSIAYQLLGNEAVSTELKRFREKVRSTMTTVTLEEEITRSVDFLKRCANYCVFDYYNVYSAYDKKGNEYIRADIIPLENLTESQRELIMGIKFVTRKKIPVYILPDRRKAMNELLDLYLYAFKNQGIGKRKKARHKRQ